MKNTKNSKQLILVLLLFVCSANSKLSAQKINRDSLKRVVFSRDSIIKDSLAEVDKITSEGKYDGRRLRLSPIQRQKFIADKKNASSDLFKPALSTVSDASRLNDSGYVKAYRMAAYNKALKYKKRTVGHYILVGGISVVSLAAAFAITIGLLFSSGTLQIGKN